MKSKKIKTLLFTICCFAFCFLSACSNFFLTVDTYISAYLNPTKKSTQIEQVVQVKEGEYLLYKKISNLKTEGEKLELNLYEQTVDLNLETDQEYFITESTEYYDNNVNYYQENSVWKTRVVETNVQLLEFNIKTKYLESYTLEEGLQKENICRLSIKNEYTKEVLGINEDVTDLNISITLKQNSVLKFVCLTYTLASGRSVVITESHSYDNVVVNLPV